MLVINILSSTVLFQWWNLIFFPFSLTQEHVMELFSSFVVWLQSTVVPYMSLSMKYLHIYISFFSFKLFNENHFVINPL